MRSAVEDGSGSHHLNGVMLRELLDGAPEPVLSWQAATLVALQTEDYRPFITALHARLASHYSKAELTAGLGRTVYGAARVLIAMLGLAIAALLVVPFWQAKGGARCCWPVLSCSSPGRSTASSSATGRRTTVLCKFLAGCCPDNGSHPAQSNVTSAIRDCTPCWACR